MTAIKEARVILAICPVTAITSVMQGSDTATKRCQPLMDDVTKALDGKSPRDTAR
ncbi:hypothetical protein D3C72_2428630 [compost metagenome]